MAGDVKTNTFMLGEATVMLAPFGTDPGLMVPGTHGLGFTQNVSTTEESDNVELRKGVQGILIDSKKSNVRLTLSTEVYEFSAQNMLYGLSLNRTAVAVKRGVLKNAVAGGASTFVVNSSPIPGETGSAITAVGDIPSGATILIQRAGTTDYVLPTKTTAATTVATADYTVTAAVPAGISFSAGDYVWVVNEIQAGSTLEQDIFTLKVAGTLSNNSRPVVLVAPKVKIRRGFNINFSTDNYGNMPFEFDPYLLTASEATGPLSQFGTQTRLFVYATN